MYMYLCLCPNFIYSMLTLKYSLSDAICSQGADSNCRGCREEVEFQRSMLEVGGDFFFGGGYVGRGFTFGGSGFVWRGFVYCILVKWVRRLKWSVNCDLLAESKQKTTQLIMIRKNILGNPWQRLQLLMC